MRPILAQSAGLPRAATRDKAAFQVTKAQRAMQTVYDWVTVAIFAGIIVIFLQRSFDDKGTQDSIWSYLPPSIGCALANYLGNEALKGGGDWLNALAALTIVGVLAYIYFVIKPDWAKR